MAMVRRREHLATLSFHRSLASPNGNSRPRASLMASLASGAAMTNPAGVPSTSTTRARRGSTRGLSSRAMKSSSRSVQGTKPQLAAQATL